MSYAVRLDGRGWRTVTSALDCVEGEVFSSEMPAPSAENLRVQRITEILRTVGRGRDRSLIQTIIAFAETVAIPALAAEYGVTFEFAKMGAYARNKTYRDAIDCETACRAIENETV